MTQDTNSAGDNANTKHAPTMWAQRNLVTFLTFKVESCNNPKVTFENNKVVFSGDDHYTKDKYYNEIEMFDEIKPEGCVWAKKGPGVECTLQKKNEGFWPRLVKEKTKIHWLKVDFNKWVDEDEADEAQGPEDDYDLSQMMAQMGGAGGAMPDMDGLEDPEQDSDDDDIPDLEEAKDDPDTEKKDEQSEDKA